MQNLQLYLFRTLPGSKKVDIRLDKMDDLYGSPSIDDIERFSRALFAGGCRGGQGCVEPGGASLLWLPRAVSYGVLAVTNMVRIDSTTCVW